MVQNYVIPSTSYAQNHTHQIFSLGTLYLLLNSHSPPLFCDSPTSLSCYNPFPFARYLFLCKVIMIELMINSQYKNKLKSMFSRIKIHLIQTLIHWWKVNACVTGLPLLPICNCCLGLLVGGDFVSGSISSTSNPAPDPLTLPEMAISRLRLTPEIVVSKSLLLPLLLLLSMFILSDDIFPILFSSMSCLCKEG